MISDVLIQERASSCAQDVPGISEDTRQFMQRVYADGLEKYKDRLTNLGFEKRGHVLDAGCGLGQWSLALAQIGNTVSACDVDNSRVEAASHMAKACGFNSMDFQSSPLEQLPYSDHQFDGLICYSVLYFTDFRKTLAEFSRVLKQDGLLYLSTNDFGFFLREFIVRPHRTANFDSRSYAFQTFMNTAKGLSKPEKENSAVITRQKKIEHILRECGFEILESGAEGTLKGGKSPFCKGTYLGLPCTYDILARKL